MRYNIIFLIPILVIELISATPAPAGTGDDLHSLCNYKSKIGSAITREQYSDILADCGKKYNQKVKEKPNNLSSINSQWFEINKEINAKKEGVSDGTERNNKDKSESKNLNTKPKPTIVDDISSAKLFKTSTTEPTTGSVTSATQSATTSIIGISELTSKSIVKSNLPYYLSSATSTAQPVVTSNTPFKSSTTGLAVIYITSTKTNSGSVHSSDSKLIEADYSREQIYNKPSNIDYLDKQEEIYSDEKLPQNTEKAQSDFNGRKSLRQLCGFGNKVAAVKNDDDINALYAECGGTYDEVLANGNYDLAQLNLEWSSIQTKINEALFKLTGVGN
ncbi:hypothetical protein K502DRAFT_348293 [Neoconidiobolus thromboides FSU 785]|nr:hypothetical protein K502DRAFT_348293 [Neoconidiobolus thromboides FSU 785]